MTRVWTCDDAVARLLEPEGSVPADLAAHLESCEECRLLSRDVGSLRAMIADARDDIDKNVPARDVLATVGLGSEERTPLHPTELRSEGHPGLRLVHDAAAASGNGSTRGRGVAGPVASSQRRAAPGRVIPLAVAIAATLVAVTATWVLLRKEPPMPLPREELVLRATGDRAPAPERAVASGEEPLVVAPSPAPAPAAPVPQEREQQHRPASPHTTGEGSTPIGEGSRERRPAAPSGRTPSSALPSSPSSPGPPVANDGPAPEVLAQRTLRGQTPRLQNCYERALRRDLRQGDATADVTVDISPDGAVQSVSVSGDASPELRRCLEQALSNAPFPSSDSGLRVSVPLRFEVLRERMGTNVRPQGTVPE